MEHTRRLSVSRPLNPVGADLSLARNIQAIGRSPLAGDPSRPMIAGKPAPTLMLRRQLSPVLSFAGVEHHAVTRLAAAQVGDGVVDLAHREVLDLRQDLMARAELEHGRHRARRTDR